MTSIRFVPGQLGRLTEIAVLTCDCNLGQAHRGNLLLVADGRKGDDRKWSQADAERQSAFFYQAGV